VLRIGPTLPFTNYPLMTRSFHGGATSGFTLHKFPLSSRQNSQFELLSSQTLPGRRQGDSNLFSPPCLTRFRVGFLGPLQQPIHASINGHYLLYFFFSSKDPDVPIPGFVLPSNSRPDYPVAYSPDSLLPSTPRLFPLPPLLPTSSPFFSTSPLVYSPCLSAVPSPVSPSLPYPNLFSCTPLLLLPPSSVSAIIDPPTSFC